jgi:hypothetical protein
MEIEANKIFDIYRKQYFEGGYSSVYFFDTEAKDDKSFGACFLIHKGQRLIAQRRPTSARPGRRPLPHSRQPTATRRLACAATGSGEALADGSTETQISSVSADWRIVCFLCFSVVSASHFLVVVVIVF